MQNGSYFDLSPPSPHPRAEVATGSRPNPIWPFMIFVGRMNGVVRHCGVLFHCSKEFWPTGRPHLNCIIPNIISTVGSFLHGMRPSNFTSNFATLTQNGGAATWC